ncbi:hypothetical protein ABFS83_12G105600 [Erythranthe nasuta]
MASHKIIFLVSFLLISLVTMKGDAASVADVVDVGEESVSAAPPPRKQCRPLSDDCKDYRCRGGMPWCIGGFCNCW